MLPLTSKSGHRKEKETQQETFRASMARSDKILRTFSADRLLLLAAQTPAFIHKKTDDR